MTTISLCMIVRDEEDVLARCLDSVADLVDEIIIVDTGSRDRTKDIARRYTQRVYDFVWIDDFAAARNAAFGYAECDYCLWLDADDVLLERDRELLRRMKESLDPQVDMVMLPYHVGFDAQGNVTFSYYRERLVKNSPDMRWEGAVHEVIEPRGNIIYADCAVTHQKLRPSDPNRNLRIFEGLIRSGEELDPRQQFYYGRELYYHQRYDQAERVFSAFLDSGLGWVENQLDACRHLAYCRYAQGRERGALEALLNSFIYDLPRAETCCDIARHFFDRELYERAAYWYERALDCPRQDERGGFVSPDAYGYLPCIQLCVCYDRLGRREEARRWNDRAEEYRPGDMAAERNRAYFDALEEQGKG